MADAMVRTRGATFHIGTKSATPASDTYTEIEKCRALDGTFGKTWSMADTTVLKDVFNKGIKTVAQGGSLTLGGPVYQDATTDGLAPGQAALKAAADDDSPEPYNFKIVGSDGRILYLSVQVSSFTRQFGNNSNVQEFRSQLLNQNDVAEAAPAGGG